MDINEIRSKFPILNEKVNNNPFVYFDNAATTQKPIEVINRQKEIYEKLNANIHRGNYSFSNYLTSGYEEVRKKIKDFINAKSEKEIIFTSGTTASINLLAYSFAERYLKEGDNIITTQLEHHSNIVPWQIVCERKRAVLKYIPLKDDGRLSIETLENLITEKTKLITLAHVSNSIGTVNDIRTVIEIAHRYNVPVMIDAAQSIQHLKIDVQELDCDFLVFSGHKIYGPTGTGVLYGKKEYLDEMPPFMGGGEMIDVVTMEKTTYNKLPFKFEAGTPNYVGIIALGDAIDFVKSVSFEFIAEYEKRLYLKALDFLKTKKNVRIIGNNNSNISVISFVHKKIPFGDFSFLLDKFGIAVRTGSHCAQPTMSFFGINGTVRLSFAFYNTFDEVDFFSEAFEKIEKMFL